MRGTHLLNPWFRYLVSFVLLTANIGSPFRSSALGRWLPYGSQPNAAAHSLIRVRTPATVGLCRGYRAVVGLGKGGPDVTLDLAPRACFASLPFPTSTPSHPQAPSRLSRPTPPLRC